MQQIFDQLTALCYCFSGFIPSFTHTKKQKKWKHKTKDKKKTIDYFCCWCLCFISIILSFNQPIHTLRWLSNVIYSGFAPIWNVNRFENRFYMQHENGNTILMPSICIYLCTQIYIFFTLEVWSHIKISIYICPNVVEFIVFYLFTLMHFVFGIFYFILFIHFNHTMHTKLFCIL